MRRVPRSSLLLAPFLLLLSHAAGLGAEPAAGPDERVRAMRHQVEDAERLRAKQLDAQWVATERAARTLAEENRLTAEQSAAYGRLKSAEAAVDTMSHQLTELTRGRAEIEARLVQRDTTLARIAMAMRHVNEHPVASLLTTGHSVRDSLLGFQVLRGVGREIVSDRGRIDEDQVALNVASAAAREGSRQLDAAVAARAAEADALARRLADTRGRRAEAEQEAAEAARRAAGEAAHAETLRSMLEILETQRQLEEARAREDALRAERDEKTAAAEAANLRVAATARPTGAGTLAANAKPASQIVAPVTGRLVHSWGEPQDGEPATGLSWRTEPGAAVVAPCGGTVAFAEPFQGYGKLAIIDCGGGFHTVLGGLGQFAVAPGQPIQSGDAVGTMPATTRAVASARAAAVDPPVLYFELRRLGRPIDPSPWLRPAN
jgi:septal ring factor EnvC (AmiA/AmiB activator)